MFNFLTGWVTEDRSRKHRDSGLDESSFILAMLEFYLQLSLHSMFSRASRVFSMLRATCPLPGVPSWYNTNTLFPYQQSTISRKPFLPSQAPSYELSILSTYFHKNPLSVCIYLPISSSGKLLCLFLNLQVSY